MISNCIDTYNPFQVISKLYKIIHSPGRFDFVYTYLINRQNILRGSYLCTSDWMVIVLILYWFEDFTIVGRIIIKEYHISKIFIRLFYMIKLIMPIKSFFSYRNRIP